jgi:hypothetical protein
MVTVNIAFAQNLGCDGVTKFPLRIARTLPRPKYWMGIDSVTVKIKSGEADALGFGGFADGCASACNLLYVCC